MQGGGWRVEGMGRWERGWGRSTVYSTTPDSSVCGLEGEWGAVVRHAAVSCGSGSAVLAMRREGGIYTAIIVL